MKTKDLILLEKAYSEVTLKESKGWFTDKNGEHITNGDKVRYTSNNRVRVYVVVGGSIMKNKVQIEVIESLPSGQSPRWINVSPTQLVKISDKLDK